MGHNSMSIYAGALKIFGHLGQLRLEESLATQYCEVRVYHQPRMWNLNGTTNCMSCNVRVFTLFGRVHHRQDAFCGRRDV